MTFLHTAQLSGGDVVLDFGFDPTNEEEWIACTIAVSFARQVHSFPNPIRDSIYGAVNFESLQKLLDGDSTAEFQFGTCCTDLRIYLGTWGVRTGYVVELMYNIGEHGGWPDQTEMASLLLARLGPITQHQLAFVCDYETLKTFARELALPFEQRSNG